MTQDTSVDVRRADSASRRTLAIVADKWAAITLYALTQGPTRYLHLQREVGGISQKMLTQTLHELESLGLIERKVFAVVPPKVEYSLTPLGKSLAPVVCAMCAWCEANVAHVQQAQASYSHKR